MESHGHAAPAPNRDLRSSLFQGVQISYRTPGELQASIEALRQNIRAAQENPATSGAAEIVEASETLYTLERQLAGEKGSA